MKNDAESHTPTHPHTLKRLGLAAVTLVLGLFVVEGAARLLKLAPAVRAIDTSDPRSVYKRSDNPILGYEHKTNYRNFDGDFISSFQRTNAHGQRDVERSLEKPPGVKRVILLGDSVVESMEVRDIEQVMHRQLERLYPPNTVEVLNFGVNGYCTLSEIELLRVKGLAFKPDVVIVVFVKNDFNNFNAAAHAFASNPERPAIVDGLFKRSHLFRSICIRLNLFGFAAQVTPVQWNAKAIGENNVVTGLVLLKELAEREGFQPVVVSWPIFQENAIVDGPTLEEGAQHLMIDHLAWYHGIPTFRLSEYFKWDYASRGPSAGPSDIYTIGDEMHVNEEGSRVAALALKAVLDALDDPARAVPGQVSAAEYARALAQIRVIDEAQAKGAALQDVRLDELVTTAGSLVAEGKLEEAMRMYSMALAMDVDPASVHDGAGNALQEAGLYQEAIERYREVLKIVPENAETHHNLGAALEALGRAQEAVASYRQALAIDPDMWETHFNLGNALHHLGHTREALEHFRKTVELKPDYADAHNNLANTLVLLGQPGEAVAHYREALRLVPRHAEAHYGWGVAAGATGDVRKAISYFEETLRLKPDHPAARRGLREARGRLGE